MAPILTAALPIVGTIIGANSQASASNKAADVASDTSKYSVDKNYDLGLKQLDQNKSENQLSREQQMALQKMIQEFTAQSQGRDIASQESMQNKQLGVTQSENAAQRALQQMLQSEQLGVTKSEGAAQRALESELQGKQLGVTQSENAAQRALQESLQKSSQDFQKSLLDTSNSQNKEIYDALVKRGQDYGSQGEASLMRETDSALPELSTLQDSIRRGATKEQQEAQKSYASNLARSGVTGSRSSNLLNRQVGDMNENLSRQINEMALQEAQKRKDTRTGYLTSKALSGVQGALSTPAYSRAA